MNRQVRDKLQKVRVADDCHGQPPPPPSANATHDAQPPAIHIRSVDTHAGGVQIGSEEDYSMQPGPEPVEPYYFDQSEQVHIDVALAAHQVHGGEPSQDRGVRK